MGRGSSIDPGLRRYIEEMLRQGYSINAVYRGCPEGSVSQTTIARIRAQIGACFSPNLFGASPPSYEEWARQYLKGQEPAECAKAKKPHSTSDARRRVLSVLKSQHVASLRELGISEREAEDIARELYDEHYAVEFDAESGVLKLHARPSEDTAGEVTHIVEKNVTLIKIGVVSDTHLCSYYERLDVLEELYQIFKREGITQVYHCGNIIDGRERFNQFEVKYWALDDQVKYLIDHYPQVEGITTYFITADHHEGWWQEREGIDVGRKIVGDAREAGRRDLVHIGYVEANVEFKARGGTCWMRLFHPRDGSAYAISYRPQKIVESYQGGMKPRILLLGHYHKFGVVYVREVYTVQAGCTQDQTRFMRNKAIAAHVGGCILHLYQDVNTGIISRFRIEWIPFFDKAFEEARKYEDHR